MEVGTAMLVETHKLQVDEGSEQVYNALDCCLTHEIFAELRPRIPEAQPAYDFEVALQAPVLSMMLRGFRVDPAARELATQKLYADLERLKHILQTLVQTIWEKPINPNSGHQLKDFFYNYLGIPVINTWVKGEMKQQMNREVLEKIEDYFQARPIVATILAIRDIEKQLQVLEKEVDSDWRMRSSYNIGGTKAARFSSSKSPTGTGDNMQNVAEHLRHVFVADPGYVLCNIDAEQSDSRMVGFMCGVLFDDWTYLDACESGDLHTSVARMVWESELPWTGDLKTDRETAELKFYREHSYRDMCKRLGHGSNFLGKAATLSRMTNVPLKLVGNFQERYFGKFPCILRWQAWGAEMIQRHKYLISIHGRRRDFFDRPNADETIRKALAFLAAAPTADNINIGMWRIWKHMPEVQLLGQVHDSIVFQFREELDRNKIVRRAQELLETPLVHGNRRFVIPTDVKLGYNWGNYIPANDKRGTPERNPRGLRKFKAAA